MAALFPPPSSAARRFRLIIPNPEGPYFSFVGKAWTPVPGHEVSIGDVFLPLILPGTLQDTAMDHDVTVGFAPAVLVNNPDLAGVSVTVPADSLYSDSGARGGMVGIAPVAPDRIRQRQDNNA